jgi:hypothetical protein
MSIGAATQAGANAMDNGQNQVVSALDAEGLTPGEMYRRVSNGNVLMAIGQKIMKDTVENAKGVKNF